MSEALKKEIADFLEKAPYCTLGTVSADGRPATHAMGFVSQGTTVYFATSRKSRKFLSIETNPNVAFSAEEATENWMQIKGVQVQGKASVVEEKDKGNVGALFIAKYPQMANMPPDPNFVFLKVTLTEAYLLDYTKGFGHRDHVTF